VLSILESHSLLYVEDEPDIRRNISEYLSHYFQDIYLADNGKTALSLYAAHKPDVLILDINLPDMSGLDVAATVRANDPIIKIIMLTAFTDTQKLLQATELRLTKYLVKPVDPAIFRSTLEMLSDELAQSSNHLLTLKDDYIWDKKRQQLLASGVIVELTATEARLLNLLINNYGQVVHIERIITTLWCDAIERDVSIDSVKNRVSRLRKKLPSGCIHNEYGQGYRFKIH